MRTLRVADLEAKPGEKVSGFVHIIGAEFGIPVTLICGEKEGETVLISGGVHNAEYVGIQAAMQLADELDPKKIAGNIIVIRLMNRTGFEHRTMSLTYEDGKNLNRVFPGNPNGTLSDRIAYTVVTEFFPNDIKVPGHLSQLVLSVGDDPDSKVSFLQCTHGRIHPFDRTGHISTQPGSHQNTQNDTDGQHHDQHPVHGVQYFC